MTLVMDNVGYVLKSLLSSLLRLPPLYRRSLLIATDALLMLQAVFLSFWLRLGDPLHLNFLVVSSWLFPAIWLIGLPLYGLSGHYKGLTRYAGSRSLYQLAIRNGALVLMLLATGSLLRLPMPPRTSWFLLWVLLTVSIGTIRFALRDVLISLQNTSRKPFFSVAVYGAGSAGVQLASALRSSNTHIVEIFVDDDPALWNRSINGVSIQRPDFLQKRVGAIDQVLLAIPSLSRSRRREIVESLQIIGFLSFKFLYGGNYQWSRTHRPFKTNPG